MKKLKKKYIDIEVSNGNIPKFNTSTITTELIPFYIQKGFGFLFEEEVKEKKKKKNDSTK